MLIIPKNRLFFKLTPTTGNLISNLLFFFSVFHCYQLPSYILEIVDSKRRRVIRHTFSKVFSLILSAPLHQVNEFAWAKSDTWTFLSSLTLGPKSAQGLIFHLLFSEETEMWGREGSVRRVGPSVVRAQIGIYTSNFFQGVLQWFLFISSLFKKSAHPHPAFLFPSFTTYLSVFK